MTPPAAVVVLSGKRKSGKDFIAAQMQERLGSDVCSILRLSGPLKSQYAKEHSLDYDRLLDASDYKEKFRADMIRWGEKRRNQNPSFFCQLATDAPEADRPVWIISDARRETDLHYFRSNFPQAVIAVRVVADEKVRIDRGFVFTAGVDNAESECGLDSIQDWDFVLTNNDSQDVCEPLRKLLNNIQAKLS